MRRRTVLASLATSMALRPCSGWTQTTQKRALIGLLVTASKPTSGRYRSGFPLGMRERGYLEGRDYVVEDRYADGEVSRLPQLATELVRLKPDVLVAGSTAGAVALRQASTSIPIVAVSLNNPIGLGLVLSEARPGTNVTGSLAYIEGLAGKQFEIALDLVPGATKIGVLANIDNQSSVTQLQEAGPAAEKLGVALTPADVRIDGIVAAFDSFAHERVDIVVVLGDPGFLTVRRQIAAFALAARLPTVYSFREHVEDGGLISYGIDVRTNYRRVAYFVDRILKGDRPADLPVEFPTKLEMVVNAATAKALRLTIPSSILVRADEVIE